MGILSMFSCCRGKALRGDNDEALLEHGYREHEVSLLESLLAARVRQ